MELRTCIQQIQQALVETIDLAYRWRYPEVQTLAELQTSSSAKVPDLGLRFVVEQGEAYRFRLDSRLPDNPPYVIAPSDRGATGRYIRQQSTVTLGPNYVKPLHRVRHGYARAIEAYEGLPEEKLERVYAQRPVYLVEYRGDELPLKSYAHGAIHEQNLDFTIHCLSRNLRPGPEAIYGSKYEGEEDDPEQRILDPGLYRMMGDIRYLLAGCRLGLDPGVKFCDIQGQGQIVERDLAQRTFTAEVPIRVHASVNIIDEDLLSPVQVWVQGYSAGTDDVGPFDLQNFVQEGLLITPNVGLVGVPDPGVATVGGQVVSVAPASHLFEASKDTYRDLRPDGAFIFQGVDIDTEAPEQESGTLRVAKTRTDATDIIADVYTCDFAVKSGDAFKIP